MIPAAISMRGFSLSRGIWRSIICAAAGPKASTNQPRTIRKARRLADRLPSAERPALEGLIEREKGTRLAECVVELPVIYREVLSLRFEEEMKLEDIAVVLDAPLSTVKTRLRRGLESLRLNLEARYPGERWI